jgi:glucosamine--fructose-6-phosphate aminotransferase (isomerizing)
LKRLEYRGYDSAGIAVGDEKHQITVRRAQGKLANLETIMMGNPIDGLYDDGHTRQNLFSTRAGMVRRIRNRGTW